MKILSDQVTYAHDSKYIDFKVNKEQRALLKSSFLIKIAKKIAPTVNLEYSVPPVIGMKADDNGNCKIQINVAVPYNEEFVKEILTQYVKASLMLLEDANSVFESVCQILNIKFKPLNPDESATVEADPIHDLKMQMSSLLFQGILKKSFQQEDKSEKENDDDFGSGLTGLKGIFK